MFGMSCLSGVGGEDVGVTSFDNSEGSASEEFTATRESAMFDRVGLQDCDLPSSS